MIDESKKRTAEFIQLLKYSLFEQDYEIELQFYLTERCNLSCPGCYMGSSPKSPKNKIPLDHIQKIIQDFGQYINYSTRICISGGEPYMIGVDKLGHVLQSVLDMQSAPELKTNGAWLQSPDSTAAMYDMLSGLNVPRGRVAKNEQEIKDYVTKLSKRADCPADSDARYLFIKEKLDEKFPFMSALNIAMSVDNLIHPAKSADWFVSFADRVSRDEKLFNNFSLGAVTFTDSMKWFKENVVSNPRLACTDFKENKSRFSFNLNGQNIIGLQQTFHDIEKTINPQDMWQVTFRESIKLPHKLVVYFYPNRTAGLSLYGEKSVGRVPYVSKNGNIKDWQELANDIFVKMVQEYQQLAMRR